MNACKVYDLTCIIEDLPEVSEVKDLFREHCCKWAFQKEAAESTGRVHYQARVSLKTKLRKAQVFPKFPGWHVSVTSAENRDNNFYVTKPETRVDGPWTDQDPVPIYIPKQIREVTNLYPWQERVIADKNVWDTRTINVIVDPVGNKGKSILSTWIIVHGIGESIPFVNDFRDVSRMVMSLPKKSLYIIDVPRALRKDQLFQFFSGIEQLKGGIAWDDRYKFQREIFDCPNVWIFMNTLPDSSYLSRDRWRYWEINNNMELVARTIVPCLEVSSSSSSDSEES